MSARGHSGLWMRRGDAIAVDLPALEHELPATRPSTPRSIPSGRICYTASVAGFTQYRRDVASLPPAERAHIEELAQRVADSYQHGPPVDTIRVIGHADFDTPRRPVVEAMISGERAHSVGAALMVAIDRRTGRSHLSRRIKWQRIAMGATAPRVPRPASEAERAQNRRVDVVLESSPPMARPMRSPRRAVAPVAPVIAQQQACVSPSLPQSATIRLGSIVFDVNVATAAFNPSTRGNIQQVIAAGTQTVTRLRFSGHRVLACRGGLDVIPAWRFEAGVGVSLPAGMSIDDWEIGFLQAVRSSRIRHVYSSGRARECVLATRMRDAVAGSTVPWYESRFVQPLSAGTTLVEDSPRTDALLRLGSGTLEAVCLEGRYQVWAAARRKTDGLLVPLLFKEIDVRRTWTLIVGRALEDPASWVHRGGQREVTRLPGDAPGAARPIVSGTTANQQGATCFHEVVAHPCPTDTLPEFNGHCIVGVDNCSS